MPHFLSRPEFPGLQSRDWGAEGEGRGVLQEGGASDREKRDSWVAWDLQNWAGRCPLQVQASLAPSHSVPGASDNLRILNGSSRLPGVAK